MDKKTIVLSLCFIFLTAGLTVGQDKTETIIVGNRDTLSNMLSQDFVFMFPKFTEGVVVFKNKELGKGLLNYNYLAKEMQFVENAVIAKTDAVKINPKNIQSLIIDQVKYILIGKMTFVNTDKGLLLQVTDFSTNLLKRDEVTILQEVQTGAYGVEVTTGSATSASSIYQTNEVLQAAHSNLAFEETQKYKKKTYFYLSVKSKVVQIKDEKQFLKLFPNRAEEIKTFITDKNTDFTSENSLVELVTYCNSLK